YKDHCENRYVLAHNIVTTLFVSRDGTVHPFHFRLYLKQDYCKEKGGLFKTKIDPAKELVEQALSLGLEVEVVLFDNWYASKEFIRFLQASLRSVTKIAFTGLVRWIVTMSNQGRTHEQISRLAFGY
ncbi:MAG: hypothetical protein LDL33_05500, partial [Desulfomonile sp.]|nr:hypothetical protein [Desulfomonile sp.]